MVGGAVGLVLEGEFGCECVHRLYLLGRIVLRR